MISNNFFVITGGPGAGKTTLILALKQHGFYTIEESARAIIQDEVHAGGDATPWDNINRFKAMILKRDLQNYQSAIQNMNTAIVFFDRGIHDLVAYDRLTRSESTPSLHDALKTVQYNKKVFVTPPWKEIYCNDAERKQSFEEAIQTYANIVHVYKEYGYEVIELPKASVTARVAFIIQHLNQKTDLLLPPKFYDGGSKSASLRSTTR